MRLRADEKKEVVAALEADYESADGAATAVYNTVVELLAKRHSYGLSVNMGDALRLAFGPYWDLTSAKQAAKLAPGASIAALCSPDTLVAGTAPTSTSCDVCEHPSFAHFSMGKIQGCVVGRRTDKQGKVTAKGCGCKNF